MTVAQIIAQMRQYSNAWRANGQTQIPVAWADYWASQLEQATYGSYSPLPPSVYPNIPGYWSPFDTFFVQPPLFGSRRVTVGPVTYTRIS